MTTKNTGNAFFFAFAIKLKVVFTYFPIWTQVNLHKTL